MTSQLKDGLDMVERAIEMNQLHCYDVLRDQGDAKIIWEKVSKHQRFLEMRQRCDDWERAKDQR